MNEPIEIFWNRYSRRLGTFIHSRVGDEVEAENILQEVFIRIHRNLCCQADWDKPESWIYQIARNLIITIIASGEYGSNSPKICRPNLIGANGLTWKMIPRPS